MAIRTLIVRVVPTNLRKKSVFLRLANTQPALAYRQRELVLPTDVDEVTYVQNLRAAELRKLWETAEPITEADYEEAKIQVDYAPFYEALIDRAFEGLQVLDIDEAHRRLVTFLDNNPDVKAQFIAINKNLRLDVADGSLPVVKREQVLWFLVLSLVNVIGGDDA